MGLHHKQKLRDLCAQYLQDRIKSAKDAIQSLQASANEETKSSAGDKYETGRAMAQLEIEKFSVQLAELFKQKQILETISADSVHHVVQPGSLVTTDQGIYFISISAGKLTIEDIIVICISAASPIGSKLLGLRATQSFIFNQRTISVLAVS
jgi:transcription elongation GreA/GreB family factor